MARAAHPTKADIERICAGMKLAGLNIRSVVLEGGRVEVFAGDGNNEADDESAVDRRDRMELEKRLYGKK